MWVLWTNSSAAAPPKHTAEHHTKIHIPPTVCSYKQQSSRSASSIRGLVSHISCFVSLPHRGKLLTHWLASNLGTLPGCQWEKRNSVSWRAPAWDETSFIQLQIPYLCPQGLLYSQTLRTSESYAAHTVKNSKNNILQSSIRQDTKKHKILNTVVVFFIWLLQLFGPTFVFLN